MDKFCNVIYFLFIIFNIVNEINMVIQNFIIISDDVFHTLTSEHVLDIYRNNYYYYIRNQAHHVCHGVMR